MTKLGVPAVLLAVCACSKGPRADDCAAAVDRAIALRGDTNKVSEKLTRDAMVASCRDTKWSPELIACAKKMKSTDERDACEKMMTPDQREASKAATRKAEEAYDASDPCHAVGASYVTAHEQMKQSARIEAQIERTGDALASTCRARKWSGDVMACVKKMTTAPDIEPCIAMLTAEQKSAYDAAVAAAKPDPAN